MSSIPDTLRRIAEQIATLEAERDRLLREVFAVTSQNEEMLARSYADGRLP